MIKGLAVFVGIALCSHAASAQSAMLMRDNCRAIAKEATVATDGRIFIPTTFEAGLCWGGFGALQGLSRLFFADADKPALQLRVPPSVTRKPFVEVFYNYADSNPDVLHEDWD